MPVLNRIADFHQDMTGWRHDFHQHPELAFEEVRTSGIVAEKLREFGVDEVITGIAKTAVVGVIRGSAPGPAIGLRADMDALPILEESGVPHASLSPGKMHACGHDGHTTMLLGAAKYLAETRNFSGTVPDPAKSDWTAGDKTQFNLSQKALGFNCLNYAIAPEGSLYRHFLPDKDYLDANCADGIRAELMFPSCWNGKDLDATNHKDHMKYPDLVTDGVCPEGFETRTPSLFYETIWNTYAYKGVPGQFVFANGDPTGYGYHGDFINGWDIDFLQSAVDTCTNPSGEIEDCPLFDVISEEEAAKCTLNMPKVLAKDDCAGPSDGLCGNVPIQYGPGYASALNAGGTAVPTIASSLPASTGSGAVTTSIMAVPTLSYKTATGAVTDSYGGGISIANVNGDISQNGEKTNSPKTTLVTISSTSIAAAATPIVTSAPASAPAGSANIVSTTTYTSAGTVYEVAIQEVDVYVTVEAADPAIDAVAATSTVDVTEGATTTVLVYETVEAKKRHARHVHMHHRRDREHGLLGRY